jgi:Tol biopolymer transport system component
MIKRQQMIRLTLVLILVSTACADGSSFANALQRGNAGAQPAGGSTVEVRRVWSGKHSHGPVSSDGRFVGSTLDGGDLGVIDLAAGTARLIRAANFPQSQYGWAGPFSPDSKRMAYTWSVGDTAFQVGIADLDGRNDHVAVSGTSTFPTVLVNDWSPDGSALLVTRVDRSGNRSLWLASLRDGSTRQIKSFDWRAPTNARFSGDGRTIAYSFATADTNTNLDLYLIDLATGRLEQLTSTSDVSEVLTGIHGNRVYYSTVSNGLGQVWSVTADNAPRGEKPVLVRGDIWALSTAQLVNNKLYYGTSSAEERVYTMSFDFEAAKARTQPEIIGRVLSGYVAGLQWSPDGAHLAYAAQVNSSGQGVRSITIQSVGGGEPRRIALGPIGYPDRLVWNSDGLLFWTSEPGGRKRAYGLDLQSGKLRIIDTQPVENGPKGFAERGRGNDEYFVRDGKEVDPIIVRDMVTRAERVMYRGAAVSPVRVSPAGTELAFAERSGTPAISRLLVMPVTGAEPRVVWTSADPLSVPSWTASGKLIFTTARSDSTSIWLIDPRTSNRRLLFTFSEMRHCCALHPKDGRLAFTARKPGGPAFEMWVLDDLPSVRK